VSPSQPPDVRAIFEANGEFVWRVLARSGVRDADLRDATQEVFIVVANKLADREGGSSVTTWLYGIAIRIAANFRRKAQRRKEELSDDLPDFARADDEGPEGTLDTAKARQRLARILGELPTDQRIIFEMFELDEMSCPAIAEDLGIPLGTVYTRLRAARTRFAAKARRLALVPER
jgi:RNA polymerase sigma-70 factor, ECF subfamily